MESRFMGIIESIFKQYMEQMASKQLIKVKEEKVVKNTEKENDDDSSVHVE
jgi:hypothetical protein